MCRGRIGDEKVQKTGSLGPGGPAWADDSCQANLLRKILRSIIQHLIFSLRWKDGTESGESYHTMGKTSGKLMKQGCTKGTQCVSPQTEHSAASVLISPGLFTGKGQLLRSGNLNSDEAPTPHWTLPTLPLSKDTEPAFLLSFHGSAWTSTYYREKDSALSTSVD